MASEVLYVPEEDLTEVIAIVRTGLKHTKKVTTEVKRGLLKWCKDEEAYLKRLKG